MAIPENKKDQAEIFDVMLRDDPEVRQQILEMYYTLCAPKSKITNEVQEGFQMAIGLMKAKMHHIFKNSYSFSLEDLEMMAKMDTIEYKEYSETLIPNYLQEYELEFCVKCTQMTNHLQGTCQKCK